ncbi:GTPase Era [Lewinella sp. W8]|uniref:GTPase Era n=1 Tax=Lewinella sp. W8 TaxID=2528208 RepID=UPI001067665D|nr:GTPase Era [Lewinella sp. W8]MTB49482.1 GTPase Era [Lewinella sp. W8]
MHRSGFVNIIGRPNAGKSTLMNALVGERMSIITAKPQTTRHRIFGILTGEDFQVVFSDTPGIIEDPRYKMQEMMNRYVNSTFEDADLMIYLIDPQETYGEDDLLVGKLRHFKAPLFLVFNKIDTVSAEQLDEMERQFQQWIKPEKVLRISALNGEGVDELRATIIDSLPEGPKYFPEEQLTDRTERFFVTEIIREQILEQYHQEIPYSVEVDIESFKDVETKDGEPLARITALIYVSRKSQKPIIIGKGGSAIKALGTAARKRMEDFLQRKVFLELHVKIREDWRDDEQQLKRFGYER